MDTFAREHIFWRKKIYGEHILARIAVAQVVPGMYNLAVLEQHF